MLALIAPHHPNIVLVAILEAVLGTPPHVVAIAAILKLPAIRLVVRITQTQLRSLGSTDATTIVQSFTFLHRTIPATTTIHSATSSSM
jgi:hypothetical protein